MKITTLTPPETPELKSIQIHQQTIIESSHTLSKTETAKTVEKKSKITLKIASKEAEITPEKESKIAPEIEENHIPRQSLDESEIEQNHIPRQLLESQYSNPSESIYPDVSEGIPRNIIQSIPRNISQNSMTTNPPSKTKKRVSFAPEVVQDAEGPASKKLGFWEMLGFSKKPSSSKPSVATFKSVTKPTLVTNPFTWIATSIMSILPSRKKESQKEQDLEMGFEKKTLKRDSAISISSQCDDQVQETSASTAKAPKPHLCSYCRGNLEIGYQLCPYCEGTGISTEKESLITRGRNAFLSVVEWFNPTSPLLLPVQNQDIKSTATPPSKPDQPELFKSSVDGGRPPRSSLDPGPSSDWSRELSFRQVTQQKIDRQRIKQSTVNVTRAIPLQRPPTSMESHQKRRFSRDYKPPRVTALDPTQVQSFPLQKILETVDAPSDIDFTDIVSRHC